MKTKNGDEFDPTEILGTEEYLRLEKEMEEAESDLNQNYELTLLLTKYDAKLMVEAYEATRNGDTSAAEKLWHEIYLIVKTLKEFIELDKT